LRRIGFLCGVFALTAAPLLLLAYLSLTLSSLAVEHEAQRGARNTATLTAVTVHDQLSATLTALSEFANSQVASHLADGDQPDPARVTDEVVELPRYFDGFQQAILTDARGIEISDSALGVYSGRDLSYLGWYVDVAADGHPHLATATQDLAGHWTIWVAVPIFNGQRLDAVLAGAYDLEAILSTAIEFTRALGMDLTVVDGYGQAVVAGTEQAEMTADSRVLEAARGRSGVISSVNDGQPVFSAYAPVGDFGWTVITDQPQADATRRIDALRWAVALTTATLLLLIVGGGFLGLRAIRHAMAQEREKASLGRRAHGLGRINEAARTVHAGHGGAAFQAIVEVAQELAGATAAGLVVVPEGGGKPRLLVRSGDSTPVADAPVAEAIERQALVIHDDQVVLPLLAGDQALGALAVAGAEVGWKLDAEEEALLRQLAQHAVTALQSERHDRELEGLLSELREQHEQLNAANRLKSEFLASMSHELRTPLSAVIGFADLLLDGIDGELNAEQREDVTQIHTSGNSLLQLINEILDLSKIEAGKMAIETAEIELAALVATVAAAMRPLADAKGLGLDIEVPAGLVVAGDPLRVRQVLTNLVANAVKFTQRGGVSVRVEEAGHQVRILVADTGIGIPPAAQKFVFDEFRQAEAGTTRKYGGTGLGLAIAKKLVELQGGAIGLESSVGKGTTFWFSLPRQAARPAAAAAPAGGELPAQTRDLVLVVEDEDATRRVIVTRLEESGFRTAEAADAESALRLARRLHPAAVTLDVILPDADGWRVLSELKGDASTADIPVVVVSILDGREVALEMGAKAFLAKPIRKRELVEAVRGAIGRLEGADVLCVDDERSAREMVRRALASAGAEVRTVQSGAEALVEVKHKVPDAVCVDLVMPEMSGFELVTRLRDLETMKHVPIIVLSARDLDREAVETLRGNVERFISKAQAQPADICATVRQTIEWSHERKAG